MCSPDVQPKYWNKDLHQTDSQVKTSTHYQMQYITDKTIPGQIFRDTSKLISDNDVIDPGLLLSRGETNARSLHSELHGE